MYQPGSAVVIEFVTNSATGAAANADALPVGTLVRNGIDDVTAVTVTNVDAGRYKASCTIPSWTIGDAISVSIAATIGGIAAKEIILNDVLIASSASLVSTLLATAVPNSNTAGTVADAFNAARAQGFGKWVLVGTTLNIYGADGVTIVRAFALDSALAPTTRV